jgi:hypothetical protein
VAGPAARLGGAGAEEAVRATREADTTEVTDRVGGGSPTSELYSSRRTSAPNAMLSGLATPISTGRSRPSAGTWRSRTRARRAGPVGRSA